MKVADDVAVFGVSSPLDGEYIAIAVMNEWDNGSTETVYFHRDVAQKIALGILNALADFKSEGDMADMESILLKYFPKPEIQVNDRRTNPRQSPAHRTGSSVPRLAALRYIAQRICVGKFRARNKPTAVSRAKRSIRHNFCSALRRRNTVARSTTCGPSTRRVIWNG
jgi:hypothetical protein